MLVTYHDSHSWDDWKRAGEHKLFSGKNYQRTLREGSIVLMMHKDERTLLGVAIVKSEVRERHLMDAEVYHAEYAKYNKYEFDVDPHIFRSPVHWEELARFCGVPSDDKTHNNLFRGTAMEYARAFYKGENEADVLSRVYRFVSLMM